MTPRFSAWGLRGADVAVHRALDEAVVENRVQIEALDLVVGGRQLFHGIAEESRVDDRVLGRDVAHEEVVGHAQRSLVLVVQVLAEHGYGLVLALLAQGDALHDRVVLALYYHTIGN